MCSESDLLLALQPVKDSQWSTYRVQCWHKCTVAHHVSRGLYIRIQCHSGVLLSVVAPFSVLHKWSCNCSTGNRGVGMEVGGGDGGGGESTSVFWYSSFHT